MPGGLTTPQLIYFIILTVAFLLLLTEKLRNDVVAVMIILALTLTGLLSAEEALSGFSSEPAIVVAGVFVLSAAISQTGLSDALGLWIGRLAGTTLTRAISVIMPAVAALSAFTHHLTMTAVMLPVTMNLARERHIAPSKLLMPMAFAASLGTTITIISAPAFIIASGVLQQSGRPALGIFSIAPVGLAMTAAGTLFMLLLGRFILPERGAGGDNAAERFQLDEYFTELVIQPGSALIGSTVEALEADKRFDLRVVGWLRDGRSLRRPFRDRKLEEGDVLLVRAAPESLMVIRTTPGIELRPLERYGTGIASSTRIEDDEDHASMLVQAVVGPHSPLIGSTIGALDFRRRYDVVVLGLWRRRGWSHQELSQIALQPGDVLVLQGSPQSFNEVVNERAFLMLVPFRIEARLRRKAPLAAAIVAASVSVAALQIAPIQIAVIGGALAMILTRCISSRQAYRAIDARIFVFIAGAIPLGAAMQSTGSSELLAGGMQRVVGGWNPMIVLFILFWVVALLTQLMSDAATTAVFAPVAVALAQGLGHQPEAYVVTVAMAAVTAFLTPIGHHGNLLIYTPGRYNFADFVRVGTPLTMLLSIIVIVMAPLLWPL